MPMNDELTALTAIMDEEDAHAADEPIRNVNTQAALAITVMPLAIAWCLCVGCVGLVLWLFNKARGIQ